MNSVNTLFSWLTTKSLILKIAVGIVLGAMLGGFLPEAAKSVSFLGALFVGALKAVAPALIFLLVISSIANQRQDQSSQMKPIIALYFIGTFSAARRGDSCAS